MIELYFLQENAWRISAMQKRFSIKKTFTIHMIFIIYSHDSKENEIGCPLGP